MNNQSLSDVLLASTDMRRRNSQEEGYTHELAVRFEVLIDVGGREAFEVPH